MRAARQYQSISREEDEDRDVKTCRGLDQASLQLYRVAHSYRVSLQISFRSRTKCFLTLHSVTSYVESYFPTARRALFFAQQFVLRSI